MNQPAPKLATAAEIGSYGERVAAAFLRQQDYRILYRNYLTERGEIDLICRHDKMLVFVEVRSRAGTAFGRPAETIDNDKQDALRRTAAQYLQLLRQEDLLYRFDAVEVLLRSGEIPVCTLLANFFT